MDRHAERKRKADREIKTMRDRQTGKMEDNQREREREREREKERD